MTANLTPQQITELVQSEIRKTQQGPPPSWEGQGPSICERALEGSYGDAEIAVEGLITEACGNSDVANALGFSWRGYRPEPPEREEVEPFVRAAISRALQARGKKPWPTPPPKPEPTPPPTGEDYAADAYRRTRAADEAAAKANVRTPALVWELRTPRGESIPVTMPELSVEERAARMLLGWCTQRSEIAAACGLNALYHYALGKDSDLERCKSLIAKVSKQR